MANPQLLKIEKNIVLTDFTSTPSVVIMFHQSSSETRYYRLKCTASTYTPTGFSDIYLYLGPYRTVPNYNYTHPFAIQSVKNSSLQDTSFEALFTQYSDKTVLQPTVQLESSPYADFRAGSVSTSIEPRLLKIELSGDNFGPTWVCPTWLDDRYSTVAGIAALTGSDQKGLQSASRFKFMFAEATARYGTSLEQYSITVTGGFSHNLTPSHIASVGTDYIDLRTYYKLVGDVTVTFTVTDTRGMSTVFTRTITIIPYKTLYLTANNTHRQGGTGSAVILDFVGRWYGSPLTLTCTGIVAKEQGSSAAFATLTPTLSISGTSFSYSAEWTGVTFDPAKAYTITATFTDTVKTVSVTLPIPVGTATMSIRNQKVGVNNANPIFTLDVGGLIGQNGYQIMGFVSVIGDTISVDANDYINTGIYIYKGNSNDAYHVPSAGGNAAFILRVTAAEGYRLQEIFYVSGGAKYTRTYASGWSSWQ